VRDAGRSNPHLSANAVPLPGFAKGGERVLLQSRYLLGFLLQGDGQCHFHSATTVHEPAVVARRSNGLTPSSTARSKSAKTDEVLARIQWWPVYFPYHR
jgi:hypothetical protein